MVGVGATMIPQLHATGYAMLARLQAGTAAYSQIGEYSRDHAGAVKPQDDDGISAVAGD